jgi:hypothetical protein
MVEAMGAFGDVLAIMQAGAKVIDAAEKAAEAGMPPFAYADKLTRRMTGRRRYYQELAKSVESK